MIGARGKPVMLSLSFSRWPVTPPNTISPARTTEVLSFPGQHQMEFRTGIRVTFGDFGAAVSVTAPPASETYILNTGEVVLPGYLISAEHGSWSGQHCGGRGSGMNLQTLIVESLRAEERAQRRHAGEREARAYLFHRDIHLSIADALGNLAASIEEAAAAAVAEGTPSG